jgi:hypothetical protein
VAALRQFPLAGVPKISSPPSNAAGQLNACFGQVAKKLARQQNKNLNVPEGVAEDE